MQELILTRGVPASGKSTWAKTWVAAAPKRVRVNRDDLRFMLYGTYFGAPIDENVVTKLQHSMVLNALRDGNSVVVDDTNLAWKFARKLVNLGHRANVPVRTKDFPVDLKEALRRNKERDRFVPEDVIRSMHDRFCSLGDWDLTGPIITPYEGTPDKNAAYIFDIDGTLARMEGRSPFEWHRTGEDTAIEHVVNIATALFSYGYDIIFLSGRDGVCYDMTLEWLSDNVMQTDWLFMRAKDDQRPDNIIKAELFDAHVRGRWNVQGVFDDRDQVVDMWRAMGIPCYQVAPGNF